MKSFEVIERDGPARMQLFLDKPGVLHLSDDTQGGITTLTVRANLNDLVQLTDEGWQRGGTVTDETGTYVEYLNGNARVLVSEGTGVEIEA